MRSIFVLLVLVSACISIGGRPPRQDIDHSSCELVRCSYHRTLQVCEADGCCEPVLNESGAYVNCRVKQVLNAEADT